MSIEQWELKSTSYDYTIVYGSHSRLGAYKLNFTVVLQIIPNIFKIWHKSLVLRLLVPYTGLYAFRKWGKPCWEKMEWTSVKIISWKYFPGNSLIGEILHANVWPFPSHKACCTSKIKIATKKSMKRVRKGYKTDNWLYSLKISEPDI